MKSTTTPRLPKLIALDGNGTLLRSDTQVSQYTREVLGRVQDLGIHVVLVTGRPFEKAKTACSAAGLRDYVITENGARAMALKDGSSLYELWLDGAEASRPIAELREALPGRCHFVQLMKDGGIIEETHLWLQDEKQRPIASQMFREVSGDMLEELKPGVKCAKSYLTVQDEGDFDSLLVRMGGIVGSDFKLRAINQLLPGISNTCEIQSTRVNKADAVAGLCKELGVSMQDVWAFGDDHNDERLLREVGWGVRMANATPALGDAGMDSTKHSNDEDGVAKYLVEHLLQ